MTHLRGYAVRHRFGRALRVSTLTPDLLATIPLFCSLQDREA